MKEIGKEKKIAIAALIVAVLMLTVAFAAMSRTLKINGTAKVDSASWDIHFENPELKNKIGDAREVAAPVISNGGIDLTLKVGLRKPKDEIEYLVDVVNSGDIDAEVESIEYPNLTEDQAKIIEFEATYENGDAISKSQVLKAKDGKKVKIVIRYKNITDPSLLKTEAYDVPLTFKINYIQKGNSISFDTESTPGENEYFDTESPIFKVTPDGTLYHYVRQGNETSVTVPATVNGVKIKKIDTAVFVSGDVIVFAENNAMILLNDDYQEMAQGYATSIGMNLYNIDEFGKGTDPVALTGTGAKNFIKDDGSPALSVSYKENHYLTSVDLSGMTYLEEIGDLAFGSQFNDDEVRTYLASVKLPQNKVLKTIGASAFSDNLITSITIPSTVETIKDAAFSHSSLTSLSIPSSVKTINNNAFARNEIKGTLVIPSSVEELGSGAFDDNEISEVVFEEPCKLTKLKYSVFRWNPITKVTIPASIVTIESQAFSGDLTEVTVLGDSTRFDETWSSNFGNATKIEG